MQVGPATDRRTLGNGGPLAPFFLPQLNVGLPSKSTGSSEVLRRLERMREWLLQLEEERDARENSQKSGNKSEGPVFVGIKMLPRHCNGSERTLSNADRLKSCTG